MKSIISIACAVFLAACDAGPTFFNLTQGTTSADFGSDDLNDSFDGVLLEQNIEMEFSRALDPRSISSSTAFMVEIDYGSQDLGEREFSSSICDSSSAVIATVSYGDKVLTFNPASALSCRTDYAICLSPSLRYQEGHAYQGSMYVFRTLVCEPELIGSSAQIVRSDDPITPITIANAGGDASACSVSPALPTGLEVVVEDGTCQVEGTTSVTSAATVYSITATNDAGESSADLTMSVIEAIPPNPSAFAVTSQTSSTLALSWTSGGGRTAGFHIKYQTGSLAPADCSSPQVTVGNVTSTTLVGLSPGTSYSIRICAFNGNSSPDDSSGVTLASQFTLAEEVSLGAATKNDSSITLNWSASSGAVTYRIKRASGGTAPADCASPDYTTAATSQLDSGLASSTQYSYRICAVNSNGDASPGLTTTVWTDAADVSFGTPIRTSSTLTLVWGAIAGVSGYRVKRAAGATAPANCSSPDYSPTSAFQLDSGLTPGAQYSYRVCSMNGNNESSAGSTITVWTLPDDPILSSSSVATGTVNLSWLAGTGAATYRVQSLQGSTAPPQYCPSPDYTTASLSQSYNGLDDGGNYTFRICSVSANSDISQGVTINRWLPPADVATFNGSAASTSSIQLSWTAGSGEAAGYYIKYASGSTAPADCDSPNSTVGSGVTTTTIDVGAPGVYSFRICAFNGGAPPLVSNGLTLTRWTLTNNPTGLTASALSTTSIRLDWTLATGSTNGYVIARASGASAPADCSSTVGSVGSATATFTDTVPSAGQYSYRVCSSNGNPTPDRSSGATVTRWTWPSELQSLTATAITTAEIRLDWTIDSDSSNNGYRISRSAGGAAPADCTTPLFSVAAGTTEFSDSGMTGGQYSYRVCAVSGNTPIERSAGLTVSKWTLPENVSDLNTAGVGATSVTLTWTEPDSADRYLIVYAADPTVPADCSSGAIISSGPPETIGGLTASTTYNFRVCTQNGNSPRETSSGSTLQVSTTAMIMMMMGSSFGPESFEDPNISSRFSEDSSELRVISPAQSREYVFLRDRLTGELTFSHQADAQVVNESAALLAHDLFGNLRLKSTGSEIKLESTGGQLIRRRIRALQLSPRITDIIPGGEVFTYDRRSQAFAEIDFLRENKARRLFGSPSAPQHLLVEPSRRDLLMIDGRGERVELYSKGKAGYFLRDHLESGEWRPELVPHLKSVGEMIVSPDSRDVYLIQPETAEILQLRLIRDSN